MVRNRFAITLAVYGLAAALSMAQGGSALAPNSTAAKVREYRKSHEHAILSELREWLAIPNVANDTANIQRNAAKLKSMLEARGVKAQLLPIEGRGPVVFGELAAPGATRTVIFYCHYDGQPTDPARWTDTKPWEPALRTASIPAGGRLIPFPQAGATIDENWRIYARSASDDKSPIVAILTALDALRAQRIAPSVNLKFIFDGEEEDGSPNLQRTLLAHRELLKGDVLINADGPVHQSGRPLIDFGNRGVMGLEITVYGPSRGLHSGHYGNWAPNPAMRLAQLLASMKDADGRVLISGFYDDVTPLSEREKRAVAEMPNMDAELKRELLLGSTDGGGQRLVEMINFPSLNIRGIRSGYVGAQAQNLVPAEATVSLDVRLVKDVDPKKQFDRIVAHVRRQGYLVVDRDATAEERLGNARVAKVVYEGGYKTSRTSMDLPVAVALIRAVEGAVGPVVKMPTSGGSSPMFIFGDLNLPVIGVPMVNHDNNQHTENENLRIGNLWRGIEIYAAIIADLKY